MIDEQKKQKRLSASSRRSDLPAAEREKMSAALAEMPTEMIFGENLPKVASAFLPLGSEINPLPLLQKLVDLGIQTALPRVSMQDAPLVFHKWSPGDAVKLGALKAPEPLASAEEVEPDFMFVPLLAFDKNFYRLGWGGGYYDRTIAGYRLAGKQLVTAGLSFAAQEVAEVPHDDYDQKLDAILTEHGYFSPN